MNGNPPSGEAELPPIGGQLEALAAVLSGLSPADRGKLVAMLSKGGDDDPITQRQ